MHTALPRPEPPVVGTPKDNGAEVEPVPHRLRNRWQWWSRHAPPRVLDLLTRGLFPNIKLPVFGKGHPVSCTDEELAFARETLCEYESIGAVERALPSLIKYFVPWFVISKQEPTGNIKRRFITNLKKVNRFINTKPFRLDHWGVVFPELRRGMFASKIDLSHAYFHCPLSPHFSDYVGVQVGDECFRFLGLPFGLNVSPQVWQSIIKVPLRIWRSRGILVFVYVDDILVLGHSFRECNSATEEVLRTLQEAGFVVNFNKSQLTPSQLVEFLGIDIDFRLGVISIPDRKRKSYRKDLGKLITKESISLRSASAILGKVRSLLACFPGLRMLTDELVEFVQLAHRYGFDKVLPIPLTLKHQVLACQHHLLSWGGRPMLTPPTRFLATDASDHELGAIDLCTRDITHAYTSASLHINVKELQASTLGVLALCKPNDVVKLLVDNTCTYYYLLNQGGRRKHLNRVIREFFERCWERRIQLLPVWVPSASNPADEISRRGKDPQECRLNRTVFLQLTHMLRLSPVIDVFASATNTQLPLFISRYPHPEAFAQDVLKTDLARMPLMYACPPWPIIGQFLQHFQMFPNLRCMLVVPLWPGCPWWPRLMRLYDPRFKPVRVLPREGLFLDCFNQPMPKPKTSLLCVALSSRFSERKDTLTRRSTRFWKSIRNL